MGATKLAYNSQLCSANKSIMLKNKYKNSKIS